MDNISKKKEQAARRDERALKRSLLREDSETPKKTKMDLVEMSSSSAKVVDTGAASGSSKMEVENVPVGEVPLGEDSSSDMHCFREVRVSRKLCLATIIQARQLCPPRDCIAGARPSLPGVRCRPQHQYQHHWGHQGVLPFDTITVLWLHLRSPISRRVWRRLLVREKNFLLLWLPPPTHPHPSGGLGRTCCLRTPRRCSSL